MQFDFVEKKLKRKKKRRRKLLIICSSFCLLFVVVFVYYIQVVCPIVVALSKEKIHSLATYSISEAVGEVLSKEQITYDQLVQISYSSQNEVELIEVDSVKVNLLIREITSLVQLKFDNFSQNGIGVALGTFSGIPFLYGVGPKIIIQLVPVGTVKTKIESSFQGAGINQTLHKVNFLICSTIGLVLPMKTENITTDLEVMICQSVIVGKIPNVYLQNQII